MNANVVGVHGGETEFAAGNKSQTVSSFHPYFLCTATSYGMTRRYPRYIHIVTTPRTRSYKMKEKKYEKGGFCSVNFSIEATTSRRFPQRQFAIEIVKRFTERCQLFYGLFNFLGTTSLTGEIVRDDLQGDTFDFIVQFVETTETCVENLLSTDVGSTQKPYFSFEIELGQNSDDGETKSGIIKIVILKAFIKGMRLEGQINAEENDESKRLSLDDGAIFNLQRHARQEKYQLLQIFSRFVIKLIHPHPPPSTLQPVEILSS